MSLPFKIFYITWNSFTMMQDNKYIWAIVSALFCQLYQHSFANSDNLLLLITKNQATRLNNKLVQ